jgi:heme oxygenase
MSRLKESTKEAHREAEQRPLMRSLANGTVSRTRFVAHLEQLLLVHRALENALERAVALHPEWSGIAPSERRRAPDLEADLQVLGGSLTPTPLPTTVAALSVIEKATPLCRLGMFYVTEGSTNGGRFLAKGVARALELDLVRREGLRSLDPYGERQSGLWEAFKSAMNAVCFDPGAVGEIEAGARAMFDQLGNIADAVAAASPA